MLKQDVVRDFDAARHNGSIIIPTAPLVVPKNLILAEKIDDLLNFRQFGHCLSECYGDAEGSNWWAKFVSPQVQGPLKGTDFEYYSVTDEIRAIQDCCGAISQLIIDDPDIDAQNLIVIEKGNGSRTAMVNKTLVQLDAFDRAGINTRLYVAREHSPTYREQAEELIRDHRPDTVCVTQDVDYNKDDPNPVPSNENDRQRLYGLDYEGPRVILEYGTSRSNIPTLKSDAVPYDELYATFAHDRKVCRDGGIMIMAADCNQDKASMEGSFSHHTHAEFSKNILRRGNKEGVLTEDFNLGLISYSPRWDAKRHLLKHALLTDRSQSFGVYRAGEGFVDARMNYGDEYLYSHSFRWPKNIIHDAACSNGFRPLATFLAPRERVAVFAFKAV